MRCRWIAVKTIAVFVHFMSLTLPDVRAQDAGTILDPPTSVGRWRAAADMGARREYAGGVRLKDGRILAVSGHPLDGK